MRETDRPHLPESLTRPGIDDSPSRVMRTLYEATLAVYFDGGWFEAYVSAPTAAADQFTLWYNNAHDYKVGWERTEIHPAALERELRERDWQLVADTHVPETEANHGE
jgi:hypothetical protein